MLLRRGGHYFYTSAEKEIVRSIKESSCYVAADPSKEEELIEQEKSNRPAFHKYKLPDGNTIEVRLVPSSVNIIRLDQNASERLKFCSIRKLLGRSTLVFTNCS